MASDNNSYNRPTNNTSNLDLNRFDEVDNLIIIINIIILGDFNINILLKYTNLHQNF